MRFSHTDEKAVQLPNDVEGCHIPVPPSTTSGQRHNVDDVQKARQPQNR